MGAMSSAGPESVHGRSTGALAGLVPNISLLFFKAPSSHWHSGKPNPQIFHVHFKLAGATEGSFEPSFSLSNASFVSWGKRPLTQATKYFHLHTTSRERGVGGGCRPQLQMLRPGPSGTRALPSQRKLHQTAGSDPHWYRDYPVLGTSLLNWSRFPPQSLTAQKSWPAILQEKENTILLNVNMQSRW